MNTKLLDISDLIINSENPRFESVENQKEAIKIMLQNKGRIKKLFQDIATNGLSPLENFAVVSKKNKYLVLEGNRRIIALKLLIDPTQTDDQKLREFFVRVKEKSPIKIPSKLSCTIFDNDDDAHHWIKLKHTGQNNGAGTVPWNSVQQDRFLKKSSKRIQVLEFGKENDLDSKNIKITNLDRLISTPYVCEKIGISFVKGEMNMDESKLKVKENLKKVFEKISKKEFKVGEIYKIEQRIKWIDNLLDSKNTTKNSDKTTATSKDNSSNASDDESANTSQENQSKSPNRKHLIPDDLTLMIPEGKINDIYLELKQDLIIDASTKSTPNAVGVLFRVFLELCLDEYIDKKKIDVSKKLSKKEKSRYKKELSIKEKISFVADYMQENNVATKGKLIQIRRIADSSNSMLSIVSFHEFVHSTTIFPEDLKSKWSNIQSFFEFLWSDLNKQGN